METGVISLTKAQLNKLDVVNQANAGFITVRAAAEKLGLSERQVQRLKREVNENGAAALIHKNSNRTPAHAIPEQTKKQILAIRGKPGYSKANFRHFQELLETEHKIAISYSALYRLLQDKGIKPPMTRRRFKPHRRRKRRPQAGSLIQMDASPYDWLDTGSLLALHGAIDDATGQITGLSLCHHECLLGYHEVMRRMIAVYGVPEAVYADRHTIFRSPHADKAKAEDAPPGINAQETQFGRAMSELGIQIIAARSPQAKGRVERLWKTLQSRLPVEFAIRGIKDMDTANAFLNTYRFAFNSEFAVEPQDKDTAFLPLEEGKILEHILCVKETRTLDHGQVFAYGGKRFQIEKSPYSNWLPPKAKITVMVSPCFGIKAAYLPYVFETRPAPSKRAVEPKPAPKAEAKKPRIYRPESPWEPKDGLLWQPGLPTYQESLAIIQEIFHKPYADKKNGKPPISSKAFLGLPLPSDHQA
jgi:transposase